MVSSAARPVITPTGAADWRIFRVERRVDLRCARMQFVLSGSCWSCACETHAGHIQRLGATNRKLARRRGQGANDRGGWTG